MTLPNANRAIVSPEKVRDYLLAPVNPRAKGKAAFFQARGFVSSDWEALQTILLDVARTGETEPGQHSEFGTKYVVLWPLDQRAARPGRQAAIRTV